MIKSIYIESIFKELSIEGSVLISASLERNEITALSSCRTRLMRVILNNQPYYIETSISGLELIAMNSQMTTLLLRADNGQYSFYSIDRGTMARCIKCGSQPIDFDWFESDKLILYESGKITVKDLNGHNTQIPCSTKMGSLSRVKEHMYAVFENNQLSIINLSKSKEISCKEVNFKISSVRIIDESLFLIGDKKTGKLIKIFKDDHSLVLLISIS